MKPEKNKSTLVANAATTLLLSDLRILISEAKQGAALAVNASLTMMYWHIGRRIHGEILGGERAEYGKEIVSTLSTQLVTEYGRGFEEKNLRRMVQFAETFVDEAIVATLWRQLLRNFNVVIPACFRRESSSCGTRSVYHRAAAQRV